MASLIEPASRGETPPTRRVAGMDSMSYSAYLYDPVQDTYKEILLSVRGSGAMQNTSSPAKTWSRGLGRSFSRAKRPILRNQFVPVSCGPEQPLSRS